MTGADWSNATAEATPALAAGAPHEAVRILHAAGMPADEMVAWLIGQGHDRHTVAVLVWDAVDPLVVA